MAKALQIYFVSLAKGQPDAVPVSLRSSGDPRK